MILHYLKISLRKIGKNIIFASINLSGLVIALSCSFLILLFVINEFSTDRFHKNKNEIYRVISNFEVGEGETLSMFSSSLLLAETIPGLIPEVKNVCRVYSYNHFYGGQYVMQGNDEIEASNFFVTDQSFFDIFSFKLIAGDKNNLMTDINSMVITESTAQKHFQDEDPIGQVLKFADGRGVRSQIITGVIKDFPSNSTISANYFGHIEMVADHIRPREWGGSATNTYIQSYPGVNKQTMLNKLIEFGKNHHPDKNYTYSLQPFKDAYFKSGFIIYDNHPKGNYNLILTYGIIGILILLIVSINYIIISTAKSSERFIEIGMRKVMGANRLNLFRQIITESVFFSLLAFPLAIILSEFSLPLFNKLIGKEINLDYFSNWPYLIGIFMITVFIGILSGSYISVYIASFNPEQIFKRRFNKNQSRFNFRKILITSQIIIFMGMLIFSSIVMLQLNYIQKLDLGFNSDDVLIINTPHDHDLFTCKTYLDEAKKNPNVVNISESFSGIFTSGGATAELSKPESPNDKVQFQVFIVDDNYLPTLGIELIEGRNFDYSFSSDTASVIINKTAAKQLGLENPVNNSLISAQDGRRYKIIGIVNDFHSQSVRNKISPVCFSLKDDGTMVSNIIAKINPNNISETLNHLERTWDTYGPKSHFSYGFLENEISAQYDSDKNFSDTIKVLVFLTIIVSSFGLFGFAFYNTKRKFKEIGVRKVYGASSAQIVKNISKEMGVLVLAAAVIAWPLSFLFASNWLNKYAYHTHIPIWIFIVSLVCTALVVVITSGATTIMAANKNPVDSLKYE